MEAKRSMTGTRRISREIKRAAVEKRLSENITWQEVVNWIYKTYKIRVAIGSTTSWTSWYREDQEGRGSHSSAEQNNGTKWWVPEEDAEVKLGDELGLTAYQIADCMNEDSELNYRNYTTCSIECRRRKLGLVKNIHCAGRDKMILECKKLLMEVQQSLVEYNNAHRIRVKCNQCDYEWIKQHQHLPRKTGCPICITPPNSYQELYMIEFPNFGNPSVKSGISKDYWNSRRKTFPKHTTVEVYQTTFKAARELEILIAEKFGEYRTTPPELEGNGITECYDISQTEEINKLIKEQLHDKNSTN